MRVDKLVVGPFENNVFIVRSKRTGDAVLLDAANEHELLLEVAAATGVRPPDAVTSPHPQRVSRLTPFVHVTDVERSIALMHDAKRLGLVATMVPAVLRTRNLDTAVIDGKKR